MTRLERRKAKTLRPPTARRRRSGDQVRQGIAAFQSGKHEEALRYAERALAAEARHPDALLLAGMSCIALQRPECAVSHLAELVRLDPSRADGQLNLGVALWQGGHLEEAVVALQRALAIDPRNADAHANLAMALRDLGDFAAAETALRAALELRAGDARLVHSLAFVISWQGRTDEAAGLYDRAVALAPQTVEYRFQRGLHRLRQGRFAEGWRDLESRWHDAKSGSVWRSFPQPMWRGEELRGKKILVWAEQGIGDQLLHAHQVLRLGAMGAQVILEGDARLAPMLGRSLPGVEVVAVADPPAPAALARDIDVQVPLASLPHHTPDWPTGLFPVARWLEPDPDRRGDIARRLSAMAEGRPTVGIAWRSQRALFGPMKSMSLDQWGAIFRRPATLFVTLQYGETESETAAARAATGADIYTDPQIDRFADLDGLAALIDSLDVVVTTSNVTAHFAGVLGKPTLLALPHLPLWYWSSAFQAYCSVERFRQDRPQEWEPVAARIASRLEEVLA